jgi:predicted Holliday junction resolvase-like endonuclease
MRALIFILFLVVSTSVFAAPWAMQHLRNQKEVNRVELNKKLQNERLREQQRKQYLQKKLELNQEPIYRKSPVFRKPASPNTE